MINDQQPAPLFCLWCVFSIRRLDLVEWRAAGVKKNTGLSLAGKKKGYFSYSKRCVKNRLGLYIYKHSEP